ncbi:transmembrane protein, putative (macronuclear) [Tetrahymena thermophila SB210]|uniref:Transmembrane protein, putative n=1 Tax=Tetrahymena thermophila (strain SB210) TaxID=312017 RepID=Q241C1_TETTS|nr:transmembrane protein, putative [Tetrahymena thermophila SB210]EAS02387.2 transmembrane protein, putative [Tetrahymena thermophila SB210]|eukprot:XP_001022632.2 transmembrane protein, putative [Tetrahymena thermophila SB210]
MYMIFIFAFGVIFPSKRSKIYSKKHVNLFSFIIFIWLFLYVYLYLDNIWQDWPIDQVNKQMKYFVLEKLKMAGFDINKILNIFIGINVYGWLVDGSKNNQKPYQSIKQIQKQNQSNKQINHWCINNLRILQKRSSKHKEILNYCIYLCMYVFIYLFICY